LTERGRERERERERERDKEVLYMATLPIAKMI